MLKQSKLFILCIIGLFIIASTTQDIKKFPTLESATFNYKNNSTYIIYLGNISIGTLSVSVANLSKGYPASYTLQFVSRIGSSPILSILRGSITEDPNQNYILEQELISKTENGSFKALHNLWREEKNGNLKSEVDEGASLSGILPVNMTSAKSQRISHKPFRFLYLENKDSKDTSEETFIPFNGLFLSNSDFESTYDSDGFLKEAKLRLTNGGVLNFTKLDQDQLASSFNPMPETLIDFGWFSSTNTFQNELELLKKDLDTCSDLMDYLNLKMTRQLPHSSYLSYRRIINLSQFCSNTNSLIKDKQVSDSSKLLEILSSSFKNILKENPQELPYSLAYSPDSSLFYNDTISFLWPKMTSLLIKTASAELMNNFELEKSRKLMVGIMLHITNMQPHAVVRAKIALIDSSLNFNINVAESDTMDESSYNDSSKKATTPFSGRYLNGQFFSRNMDIPLNEICNLNKGKIGIDLGESSQIAINSDSVRGTWDNSTRIELARQFAIRASIAKSCSDVSFRIPSYMKKALTNEISKFKKDILGTESELLLSNNLQKRIWALPGKYRLVVTSLVTGSVLSAQEFSVASDTNTNVTAKIN